MCILKCEELTIEVDGADYRFDWHDYMGPFPLNKRGGERLLAARHPFWKAVTHWSRQGKRTENGRCIWDQPPDPPDPLAGAIHLWGNNYYMGSQEQLDALIARATARIVAKRDGKR